MSEVVTGGCTCGAARYRAELPVKFAMRCQCHASHMHLAAVSAAGKGEPALSDRTADIGHSFTRMNGTPYSHGQYAMKT